MTSIYSERVLRVRWLGRARSLHEAAWAWRCPLPPRAFVIRVVAVTVLGGLYYLFEWTRLRELVSICTAALLRIIGNPATFVQTGTEFYIVLQSGLISISADCTYVVLVLLLAPFIWRSRYGLTTNAIRLGLAAVVVLSVNLARLVLALTVTDAGAPWFLAHTLPDIMVYYPALAASALLALRSDQELRRVSHRPARA